MATQKSHDVALGLSLTRIASFMPGVAEIRQVHASSANPMARAQTFKQKHSSSMHHLITRTQLSRATTLCKLPLTSLRFEFWRSASQYVLQRFKPGATVCRRDALIKAGRVRQALVGEVSETSKRTSFGSWPHSLRSCVSKLAELHVQDLPVDGDMIQIFSQRS